MAIQAIAPIASTITTPATAKAAGASGDFGQTLTDVINRLSETERGTSDLVTRAAAGEDVDVHDVMIATQAESLSFQVAMQVRNKLVEAYQEVFRMQV